MTERAFTHEQMQRMFDDAWKAVDPAIRRLAVKTLKAKVDPSILREVKAGVAEHGTNLWVHKPPFTGWQTVEHDGQKVPVPYNFHHGIGMNVRNLLRSVGLKDVQLPPFDAYYGEGTDVRNWDDYYVQALEAAAGARDV